MQMSVTVEINKGLCAVYCKKNQEDFRGLIFLEDEMRVQAKRKKKAVSYVEYMYLIRFHINVSSYLPVLH